jgi:hypothetical protein
MKCSGADLQSAPEPLRMEVAVSNGRVSNSWLLVYVLIMVVGLVLVPVTAVDKFGDEAKKERLAASGVPATAVVADFRAGGRQTSDKILLAYEFNGIAYHEWIKGSAEEQVSIKVDPDHPDEFLAANGHTDDSLALFNTWAGLFWGVGLVALGMVPVVMRLRANRPGRSTTGTTVSAAKGRA